MQPTRSLTVRSGTRGSDARCPSLPIYVGDAHDCDRDWDLPKTSTSQTAKGGDAKRSHKLLAGGAKLLPFVVDLDIISFTFATIVIWSQLSKFLEGSAARTNTHLPHPLLSPSPHPSRSWQRTVCYPNSFSRSLTHCSNKILTNCVSLTGF